MIKENIKKWHDHINGDFPGGFEELLADNVIFYSPIVFSPQKGKDLTTLYLMELVIKYPQLAIVPDGGKNPAFLAMMVPKGDKVWNDYVSNWIQDKQSSGFFKKLLVKYNLKSL